SMLGVTGVVDPETMAALYDVVVTEPGAAVAAAVEGMQQDGPLDVIVVVAQGDLAFARLLARAAPDIDFVIVGRDPANTDEVVFEGETAILQGYSQGRHVGALKLYDNADSGPWQNVRHGTVEEIERLDRRIAYIDEALNQVPPAAASQESAFVTQKRKELDELIKARLAASSEGVEVPAEGRGFAFFSVAMKPGYPLDVALHQRKNRYTEGLESLYAELAAKVPEPEPGQASFVRSAACGDGHDEAHEFWLETPDAHALATLVRL